MGKNCECFGIFGGDGFDDWKRYECGLLIGGMNDGG